MQRLVLILCFQFFLSTKILACSCAGYIGPFMQTAKHTSLVALVKVTKYLTFDSIYNKKTPMSMEVEMISVYRGVEKRRTVTVWGDNGMLCRPYLSSFKEGQYYVIAFNSGRYGGSHADEKDTDYAIGICGEYWLDVNFERSEAKGDIDSRNRTVSTISLTTLEANLRKLKW
jgi:hypothetical protein